MSKDHDSKNSDSESNSFTKRMGRYAKVSTNMSGSFARFLGDRIFGRDPDHATQAQALTMALGNLKGPVMKVAQMLATIPDAVPQEYQMEFLNLQADAPSMGWPFVKRRMAAELGDDWQSNFTHFERVAASAASLGQVHKATTLDGDTVACKLQYPDMTSIVEADLKQLKFAMRLYESTLGGIKTVGILEEISERLREELEYRREAKQMRLYEEILSDFNHVHVPKVKEDLSTNRLLTMTWLEGQKFTTILEDPQEVRNYLAREMFFTWYYPLYHWGVIHGDPHLGNYTFRKSKNAAFPYEINLLDFGCIRRFKPSFMQGVIDLYHAIQSNDREQAVHAYEQWGFDNLSKDMLEVLNLWAKLLYDPLLDDRVRPIQKDHSGQIGRDTADKVHNELRRLGGVAPPREFVFMDRAAVGIGSVCLHLRAEQNWYKLFHQLIADFSIESIEEKQKHPRFTALDETLQTSQ